MALHPDYDLSRNLQLFTIKIFLASSIVDFILPWEVSSNILGETLSTLSSLWY